MDIPQTIEIPANNPDAPPLQGRILPVERETASTEPETTRLLARVEHYLELAEAEKNADALALTGCPDLREARLAVLGARQTGIPLYVLIDADEEGETSGGDSLLACLICLQALGIAGFAAMLPADLLEPPSWLRELETHAAIPLYAGQAGSLRNMQSLAEQREELVLCGGKAVHYLEEDFSATGPIACEPDMSEAILEAEDQGCDLLLFRVETQEDAEYLSENLHMALDAVGFLAEGEEVLEAALFHYPGRALIDARSDVPEERMQFLAEGYGAVIR